MRLRIEVTKQDMAKATASRWFRWLVPQGCRCPVYYAIVRRTGYRRVEVKPGALTIHWVRYSLSGAVYAFPPEVTHWLRRYHHDTDAPGPMEPFSFDLELDTRGARLLGLSQPCVRCGDYPREHGNHLCTVCQAYREAMRQVWR